MFAQKYGGIFELYYLGVNSITTIMRNKFY